MDLQKDVNVVNEFCETSETAKKLTKKYFTKKHTPDAVFCMSDEILIGVVKSLNDLKINIPEALAVLALSDGFLPKIYTPEISYIETSGYKLGKLAFAKMINCFNGINENTEDFTKSVLVKGGSL